MGNYRPLIPQKGSKPRGKGQAFQGHKWKQTKSKTVGKNVIAMRHMTTKKKKKKGTGQKTLLCQQDQIRLESTRYFFLIMLELEFKTNDFYNKYFNIYLYF